MRKGCQICAIEVGSKDNKPHENSHPILSEFVDVFPSEVPRLPPIRDFDFTIPLKPNKNPYPKPHIA